MRVWGRDLWNGETYTQFDVLSSYTVSSFSYGFLFDLVGLWVPSIDLSIVSFSQTVDGV